MVKKLLIMLVSPALIIFLIWLPFGFALTGLIEEWGALGLFAKYGLFWLTLPNSPMAAHALRPLTVFPHALAYYLDPNSFKYWHIILILSLFIKGFSTSYISMKMLNSYKWSAIAGMLVLVYPADTMQLSFRSFHINLALAFVLLSGVFCLFALDATRGKLSYFMTFVGSILLLLACCLYEASLVLLPLPFMVFLFRSKRFKNVLNQWKIFLIWILGAVGYALYVLLSTHMISGKSYQASIVTEGNPFVQLIINSPKLISIGVVRTLLDGWLYAVRLFFSEFNHYGYFFVVLILLGTLVFYLDKIEKYSFSKHTSVAFLLRWMFIGFTFILLGYSPFLLLHWHQGVSQRTFLFATPGAVFFLIPILVLISKKFKILANLCAILLILFGLGTQLYQFQYYTQISNMQRSILKQIAEKFDGNLDKNKTIILVDKSNRLGTQWVFPSDLMSNLFSYLYGKEFNNSVQICHWPSGEWMEIGDDLGRKGKCIEKNDAWVMSYPEMVHGPNYTPKPVSNSLVFSKKDVFVLTIDRDVFDTDGKNRFVPERLKENKYIVSQRYNGFIANKPWFLDMGLFKNFKEQDSYEWYFGKWWSLDVPVRGTGWRGVEWNVNQFSQSSAAWKTAEKSSIEFDFFPKNNMSYILEGYFTEFVNDNIKEKLKIFLNKSEIKYIWVSQGYFKAEIQSNTLINGVNEIVFTSPLDFDFYGLSAKLSWFKIYPKSKSQN